MGIVQPIITPSGEIYQIPIQLNAEQLQMIRGQMMGGAGSSQNIVIQTAPIQTQLAHPAQTIQLQGGQQMYYIQYALTSHCHIRCVQPDDASPLCTHIESPMQPLCTSTELNIAHPISKCTAFDKTL